MLRGYMSVCESTSGVRRYTHASTSSTSTLETDRLHRSIQECQNSGIEILRRHTGRLIFEVSSRGAHDVQEICESIADMKLESLSKDSYKLDRCLTFAPNLKPSEPGP